MADVITVETGIDWLAFHVKDEGLKLFTRGRLRSYLLSAVVQGEQSFQFSRNAKGVYTNDLFGLEKRRMLWVSDPVAPFAGDSLKSYYMDPFGSIFCWLSADTDENPADHSSSTISVLGTIVDLRHVLPAVWTDIGGRSGKDVAVSLGLESFSPQDLVRRAITMGEWGRGGVT